MNQHPTPEPTTPAEEFLGCAYFCGVTALALGVGKVAGDGWGWITLGAALVGTFVGFGLSALRRNASG